MNDQQVVLINLDFDNFSSVIKSNLLLWLTRSVKMFTTKKKIQKDKDAEPTEFEETVAQVSSLLLLSVFLDSCFKGIKYVEN
jgi:hypothetical protein